MLNKPDQKTYRVGIVAGEQSGDLLAAELISAVNARNLDIQFEGVAGDKMLAVGCKKLFGVDELSVMGLFEILNDLPRLMGIKNSLLKQWQDNPPDLFIGVDAPDFNLRIAPKLKKLNIPTIQYVCPSVWAWRQGRVQTIENSINDLFCLLPFEPEYFFNSNTTAHYVGHPLADNIAISKRVARETAPFQIAILPGSRRSEVSKLLRPFLQSAIKLLEYDSTISFVIPVANNKVKKIIVETLSEKEFSDSNFQKKIELDYDGVDKVLRNSDFAIIASGTVSLEAMLYACPMLVCYKLSTLTYWFLKVTKAYKAKYFALPNIIANDDLVPELLQGEVCEYSIVEMTIKYLESKSKRQQQMEVFNDLHQGLQQNTNEKVASLIISKLTSHASS